MRLFGDLEGSKAVSYEAWKVAWASVWGPGDDVWLLLEKVRAAAAGDLGKASGVVPEFNRKTINVAAVRVLEHTKCCGCQRSRR
jgi:hypothetical protein